MTAYSPTLPKVSDGNLILPAVHGQYATGGPVAVNAAQVVQFDSGVTGGTFTLSYNGQSTAPIAYSSSVTTLDANITSALNTLLGTTGSVTVAPTNSAGRRPTPRSTAWATSSPTQR